MAGRAGTQTLSLTLQRTSLNSKGTRKLSPSARRPWMSFSRTRQFSSARIRMVLTLEFTAATTPAGCPVPSPPIPARWGETLRWPRRHQGSAESERPRWTAFRLRRTRESGGAWSRHRGNRVFVAPALPAPKPRHRHARQSGVPIWTSHAAPQLLRMPVFNSFAVRQLRLFEGYSLQRGRYPERLSSRSPVLPSRQYSSWFAKAPHGYVR